jgi:hypothetical protein
LNATIRVQRWEPTEAVPEPLRRLAVDLPGRVDLASRLAAGTFVSTSADTGRIEAMRLAAERLVAAYGVYRGRPGVEQADELSAITVLEDEIGQARADSGAW